MAKKKAATKGRAKKTINKSAAVREYMAANPDAKPKEVSEKLTKKGIKVTPQAVSTIKFQAAKSTAKSRRPSTRKRLNGSVQIDMLVQAKQLADKMGGIEKAKHALDVLAKLA